jgi:hypothetical protein
MKAEHLFEGNKLIIRNGNSWPYHDLANSYLHFHKRWNVDGKTGKKLSSASIS